jgi:DNA invertase Pin-like site-specific DNA recombinase
MIPQGRFKVGIWVRVSTGEQHANNQLSALKAWAARRGWEVAQVYEVQESAWKGAHQKALTSVYQDARAGRFQILLIWALDRLSREGPLATLETVHRLLKSGVQVYSLQEPWLEVGGEMVDLLLALTGWVARYESSRRSERTRAGLVRAVAQGKKLGRPKGSQDKRRRKRSGYFARYADGAPKKGVGSVV